MFPYLSFRMEPILEKIIFISVSLHRLRMPRIINSVLNILVDYFIIH